MLHTDIITSIPAVAEAHAAFTEASKAKDSLGLIASRRHAEWQAAVAKLDVGTALPVEPSPVPTDHERMHADTRLSVAREALKAALNAHSGELAESFRTREQQALAEVRELASRIEEIADGITDLLRDVIWFEHASGIPVGIPQGLFSDVKGVILEIAHGGSVGRNHRAGTFLANI